MNVRTLSFERDRLADWRHWLPPALEVVLVVLLAAQAARLLWMLLVPVAPIGVAAATVPLQASAPSLPLVDLFFRSASHAASPGSGEALGYSLHGVRTDGTGGSAILEKDGRQTSYAVGREIAPGIRLEAVGADHAVLVSGSERHRLELPRHSTARTAPGPAARSSRSRVKPVAPAPASTPGPANASSSKTATVNPSSSSAAAAQQEDGYAIPPGEGNPLLRLAGLQPGDVVLSVNGRAVDPARLGDLKQALAGQPQATIRYRRGGTTHTTTVKAPQ
ncbi:type II secretion system protein N [Luteimonas soli]|uniref:Type II secretion system protein N n=1 Tax=Luteimonas soli TaxID=1648966 RepID=A0ABV7XME0_9GAMM